MNRKESALIGSLVADAMALGPHWIYDTEKIKTAFGDIKNVTSPLKDSFHPTKKVGDFTHYGDLIMLMLSYINRHDSFDRRHFLERFRDYMKDYQGYKDHAMKDTLKNIKENHWIGSDSQELGGLSTLSVFYYYFDKPKEIFKERIKATHNNPLVLEISDFIFSVLDEIESGRSIKEAILKLKSRGSKTLESMIERVFKALNEEESTVDTIKSFGQMCDAKNAFPSMLYIVLKYQDSYEKAVIENIKAGGDSAARGILIGTLIGAYLGEEGIPKAWTDQLNRLKEIREYL